MELKKILFASAETLLITGLIISITIAVVESNKEHGTDIVDNSTTIILVQEEQEMSIKEIVEEEKDAEIYIPEQYKTIVNKLCKENDVPLYVFAKLIQSESRWKVNAKRTNYLYNKEGKPVLNKDGTRKIHSIDRGIAQLNSLNYEEFAWRFNENKVVDPYDANMSLKISCRYLSWLYDRTHSWYDAVCAYKSGLNKVRIETVPLHIVEISKAIIDPKISALDPKYFP